MALLKILILLAFGVFLIFYPSSLVWWLVLGFAVLLFIIFCAVD